ncbi:prepilin-type N-terminal cleavage/methylation domain-containing protein [Microcoleus sp. FACHB-53]|nr:prepilin-type N-terminal cleavage/methylation domain-containing protein [Microcoleus sp. FACHB-53]
MNRANVINLIALIELMGTNQQGLSVAVGYRGRRLDGGYTLPEVVVVLLMMGLLGVIAAPSWLLFWQRQQVRRAAGQLQSALQLAKSEAAKNSVRYAVTACENSPYSPATDSIEYSVHPYSERPYGFTEIANVSIVKSTVRYSPTHYNLQRQVHGDCYTTYLGLFPDDGYALGFFYLSNGQQNYFYRVGFNTLIGNIVSCPVLSLENAQCQ